MTVADLTGGTRRLWSSGSKKKAARSTACLAIILSETYLRDYIKAAKIADDRVDALFRTTVRRTGVLTDRAMTQSDA